MEARGLFPFEVITKLFSFGKLPAGRPSQPINTGLPLRWPSDLINRGGADGPCAVLPQIVAENRAKLSVSLVDCIMVLVQVFLEPWALGYNVRHPANPTSRDRNLEVPDVAVLETVVDFHIENVPSVTVLLNVQNNPMLDNR